MKIKAICRHEIVYKNGKSPLAIRFTHQRTHKTVSLGISVEPHYWDKNAEMITANCPERAALQSQIDNTLAGYLKRIQRLEALDIPITFDTLFETDKGRHAGITIEDGFNAEIERLESLGTRMLRVRGGGISSSFPNRSAIPIYRLPKSIWIRLRTAKTTRRCRICYDKKSDRLFRGVLK